MHVQNFILIAGAETRRTFAKGDEKKYPGNAQLLGSWLALLLSEASDKLFPCMYDGHSNLAVSCIHATGQ